MFAFYIMSWCMFFKKTPCKQFLFMRQYSISYLTLSYLILPSKAASSWCGEGRGWFLSRVYIDMTNPGVQNPHCDPWAAASFSCTGTMVQVHHRPSSGQGVQVSSIIIRHQYTGYRAIPSLSVVSTGNTVQVNYSQSSVQGTQFKSATVSRQYMEHSSS